MSQTQGFSRTLLSRALGVSVKRDYPAVFTDSRKPVSDGLFVAISGDQFDGHAFIPQAVKGGAAGVLCTRETPTNIEMLVVPDTVKALRAIAGEWRRQFKIPVIAVVGNVGKTTTKELLAQMLTENGETVLKTEASENGWVGIGLTLLKLRPEHTVAVIEIGIDEPGSMQPHMELVDPTALVVSSLGPEHLEKLGRVEDAVEQELIAVDFMHGRDRPVILPAENSFIAAQRGRWPKAQFFSTNSIDPALAASLPHASPALLSNAIAAWTTARAAGFKVQVSNALTLPKGRAELKEKHGTFWVLDYYNSNPDSLKAGLQLLEVEARQRGHSGIRAVFLGDMRELGPQSSDLHAQFASILQTAGIEKIFLAGPEMAHLYKALLARRFQGQLVYARQPSDLIPCLGSLNPRDTILLKGSRGMRMEVLWHAFSDKTGVLSKSPHAPSATKSP